MYKAYEVVFVGGAYNKNSPNTYYYRNSIQNGCTGENNDLCSATGNNFWWTMSPYHYSSNSIMFRMCGAGENPGNMYYGFTNSSYAVRPVITLKPDVRVTGSGTTDDPYEVFSPSSDRKIFNVKVSSNNDKYGTLGFVDIYAHLGEDFLVHLLPNEGYEYYSNTCGGVVNGNTMTISNISSDRECKVIFKAKSANNENLYTLLSDERRYEIGTRSSFAEPFGGEAITQGYNQTGQIYLAEDNYYFAGNPSDNWVKFADKWWRIIRTNSTEGTRLLYAGTSHDGQDGYINGTTYVWSENSNVSWENVSFVSDLTEWYNNNIGNISANDNIVNNVLYCNSILSIDHKLSYICDTNNFGSAAKVGLMTADEVMYAGGPKYKSAPNTYFIRNSISSGCTAYSGSPCSVTNNTRWWTMSAYKSSYNNNNSSYAVSEYKEHCGYLNEYPVNDSNAVRPVITLKPDVLVSGSGTTEDPFVPSL